MSILLQFEDRSGVSATMIERAINATLNDNPGFEVVEATIRIRAVTPGYSDNDVPQLNTAYANSSAPRRLSPGLDVSSNPYPTATAGMIASRNG